MRGSLLVGLAALAAVAGCGEVPSFECDFDSDCNGGICTDDAYCARHDQTCASTALRYDDSAGEGLGGQCVEPDTPGLRGDTFDDPLKLVDTRTVDITDAGDDFEASCARAGGRDIFFELTLDSRSTLSVDTIGTTFSVDLAVFAGGCNALGSEVGCDQTTCTPRVKLFSDLVDPGTYCIVADEDPAGSGGTQLVVHADINGPAPSCAALQ